MNAAWLFPFSLFVIGGWITIATRRHFRARARERIECKSMREQGRYLDFQCMLKRRGKPWE